MLTLVTAFYFNLPTNVLFLLSGVTLIASILLTLKAKQYQQITIDNLLLHINRVFPQVEESAQLIRRDDKTLSLLQRLQKQKVSTELVALLSSNQTILPVLPIRKVIINACLASLILMLVILTKQWPSSYQMKGEQVKEIQTINSKTQESGAALLQSKVIIKPPSYTQLEYRQQNDLNATILQGSLVQWQIQTNKQNQNLFIEFSSGDRIFFKQQVLHDYFAEKQVTMSGIYRLGFVENGIDIFMSDFYTFTVVKDQKPTIKFISPKNTITEIAKNSPTIMTTQVQISDDFKVDKVEILASIAKGTGEAVKFRDQIFHFDTSEVIDGVTNYFKTWQLTELAMQAGDELYFTVKVWDNRAPQAQLTRSNTKIIRWLDDEDQAILSDGILIDFMPEYFKSQRQIIIETTELINDQALMTAEQFSKTSELLGVAQSQLKERYGQYLGDEVEDGGGSHAISDEATEHIAELGDMDHDHTTHLADHNSPLTETVSESQHEASHDHASDDFAMSGFGGDRSGASELIAQFGHNHEDADIGIMGRQDPKALMKRSIANMWQAELHLMLSQPSKAIPYENEALKYLKMAKKAERIYVKRLGFEPPPVSEQRRYQGDLADVLTYKQHQTLELSKTEQQELRNVHTWLNGVINKPNNQRNLQLSEAQRANLIVAKNYFQSLLDDRPTLVKYLAIFEQILLENTLELTHCASCLIELNEKIWEMLPKVVAKPMSQTKPYAVSDKLTTKYAQYLLERP